MARKTRRKPPVIVVDEPRSARLGASDIAAVLGLSKFKGPHDVWSRKHGLTENDDSKAVFLRGHRLEPAVLDYIADETGAQLATGYGDAHGPWVVSPLWEHVGCHPDGFLYGGEFPRCWSIAEAKTSQVAAGWGPSYTDEFPPYYYVQVLISLALTGLKHAHLGVYMPVHDDWRIYATKADDELAERILTKASEWWDRHIIGGDPPPVDGTPGAREMLGLLYPKEQDAKLREATPEEVALVLERQRLKGEEKALKERLSGVEAQICAAIGDAAGLELPDKAGKATWKAQTRTTVDTKAMRQDSAVARALVGKHTKTSSSRVLRVNIKEPKE